MFSNFNNCFTITWMSCPLQAWKRESGQASLASRDPGQTPSSSPAGCSHMSGPQPGCKTLYIITTHPCVSLGNNWPFSSLRAWHTHMVHICNGQHGQTWSQSRTRWFCICGWNYLGKKTEHLWIVFIFKFSFVFILFERGGETDGTICHCSSPQMPTVARGGQAEATVLDLSVSYLGNRDPSARAVIGCIVAGAHEQETGLKEEEECGHASVPSPWPTLGFSLRYRP